MPSADGVAEFAGTAPVQRGLTVDDAAAAHGDTARARAAMDTLGWSGGKRREWYRGARTWMAVQVEQLAGEAEAFDYDLFALLDACHDAAAAYAVPGLADAVGLRLRRPGGVVERVSFVRGARRYTVEVAGAQQPDAATVTALAVAAASVAR